MVKTIYVHSWPWVHLNNSNNISRHNVSTVDSERKIKKAIRIRHQHPPVDIDGVINYHHFQPLFVAWLNKPWNHLTTQSSFCWKRLWDTWSKASFDLIFRPCDENYVLLILWLILWFLETTMFRLVNVFVASCKLLDFFTWLVCIVYSYLGGVWINPEGSSVMFWVDMCRLCL